MSRHPGLIAAVLLSASAAAALVAACVHRRAATQQETAVEVHGRILTEGTDKFGVDAHSGPRSDDDGPRPPPSGGPK